MYRKSILFQDAKETENGVNEREENRGSNTVFPGIVSSTENGGNSGRVEDSGSIDTPIMLSSGLRETNQTYPGSERSISGSNMDINNMSESNGNGRNNAGENEKSGSKSNSGATPVIPLPNPGEGGPVYPGNNTGGSGNGNTGNGSNMGGNNSNGNT